MADFDKKNPDLLNAVVSLCEQVKQQDTVSSETIFQIENFLYGSLVKGMLITFLAEENKAELKEKFGITEEEIDEVRHFPALVSFTEDNDPQGSEREYMSFKEMIETTLNPKIIKFMEYYEELVLLKDCQVQIDALRAITAHPDAGEVRIGFTDANGIFTDLSTAKFNYFNNYTDEELDDIYNKSPHNRAAIEEVREFRKNNS